jgi:pimeloyl-ACP methyl ester carboxylesterase/tetratricopeptide (TPR) repeat protein
MTTKTLRFRGSKEGDNKISVQADPAQLSVTPKGRVLLGAARDAGEAKLEGMALDDVVCVQYSNGFKLWTRVDDLHRAYPASGVSRTARGVAISEANVWEIDPRAEAPGAERGTVGIVIEALDFFGVDLKEVAAETIASRYEDRKLKSVGKKTGLYRVSLQDPDPGDAARKRKVALSAKGKVPTDQGPLLVFIHGTASNTEGGFGTLWAAGNTQGATLRKELENTYKERVYAYEHRTLTISPIDNALELAKSLPDGAELHLVSHSRGGLVGELLCLGQRQDKRLFDKTLLERLFAKDRTPTRLFGFGPGDEAAWQAAYDTQRKKLIELLDLLDKKQFKISRFVRVACPARGTTLASGRLDRWLSILSHLAPDVLEDGVDFLLGVVKKRTDPRVLPGLEAQMPGSALVTLLNHPDLVVDADLSVIAGDIEGESVWSKLKIIAADWFYAGDHDLVVNTGSMYGGARRPDEKARFFFDQGKEVTHFRYFSNSETVDKLAAGLLRADDTRGGYKPISEARQAAPAYREVLARAAASGEAKPVVFVLPGTMGSELALGDDRIWLSYFDLARGKLARLGRDAKDVRVLQPVGDFYGDLMIYLSRSHRVEPFAYDWRLSITQAADGLAARITEVLPWCEQNKKPMRFLAHSMGGLVVRAFIAKYPALWERVGRLDGSRFIMLGTPNFGSFEAVRWLTGQNPTGGKITLLDCLHDRDEIIDIVRRYPGLLELLPSKGVRTFSASRLWQDLRGDAEETWPLPDDKDLAALDGVWDMIRKSPIDPARMIYVAGWAPKTVCDYEVRNELVPWDLVNPHKVLRFYANKKGDGTVPWDLGRLPDVKTWYVEGAKHDELTMVEEAFPAYLELLQKGETNRLPDSEPAVSRSAADALEIFDIGIDFPDSVISAGEISSLTFGGSATSPGKGRRRKHCTGKVKLKLSHGDLSYALNPVVVGHYMGDSIVSAEKALDDKLNGMLSQRARLGLYPGRLGSQFVAINSDRSVQPGGAIVIGLGQVGELSPGKLEQSISRAVLEYVLAVANWNDDRFGGPKSVRSAKLSFLLIGTGAAGVKVDDSLRAILRGVLAAVRQLDASEFCDRVTFDEFEIMELYLDVALQAARALERILKDSDLDEQFDWHDRTLTEGVGGRRRLSFDEDAQWWRRLVITHDRKRDELRFIALTDRARAEESLVTGQLRLAEDFIAEAQKSTGNDDEVAMTLFEMLLPNRFKEIAPDHYDVVLLLDEQSARFPWEMLTNSWSVNGKPLSVEAGMLRQLKTAVYRERPAHPLNDKAFVVGNPKLPAQTGGLIFPDLPGAVKEAELVEQLLDRQGFTVTSRINAHARDIMIGLHDDGYRVLHLAGHGVHELEIVLDDGPEQTCDACDQPLPKRKKKVSGMVIGKDTYLTPGDVEQIRWVPELVFINCCHLGHTTSALPEWNRYSALAANLATQFIKMGVRAVVAAGWAVDDSAAKLFAQEFYELMLDGEAFGRAVQQARKTIHERCSGVNTWGAYQCYGDPDFRLVIRDRARKSNAITYQTPAEAVVALDNLCQAVRIGWAKTIGAQAQLQEIQKILKRIPADHNDTWLKRADINSALGFLHGERASSKIEEGDVIPAFEAAVDHFRQALAQERADVPVRALEKCANYTVKLALQRWLRDRGSKSALASGKSSVKLIEDAIRDIDVLLQMQRTTERFALSGSAYKRKAWILQSVGPEEDFDAALAKMAEQYDQAKAEVKGKIDPYPITNWLAAQAVMSWRHPKRKKPDLAKAVSQCAKAKLDAEEQNRTKPDFWNSVVQPDCDLAMCLMDLRREDADKIKAGYQAAIDRGCSPSEKGSVLEHLQFLEEMARQLGKAKIADVLLGIRQGL